MEIGDEIVIKCKVVDFDANPHGAAIKVELKGFIDHATLSTLRAYGKSVRFWIHRLDQPEVVVSK
ncbi:hypothetical protein A3B05_03150 [Candidatus Giovannonibacteria bacterium RIFCSPLOWO2_01_FULL_43_160]|uniref:Uncharacterized protein n=2 Tax=Candidatus Giovannoniibacteriota TaxID=1752738 RepID=A0A0G1L490_9BACT|nr:MAG: hypothetical protein UV72_C0005G0040 [Candidatus Giovannonibacteria bacterium GW2011_GWB1_43_13]KKS99486.1 MAG: hypothetical protein UV75_C0004G0040 [Candidatus Giovannonibacteria bacterium GW2011_GWA1_43_15]KKT21681.1 MAG: hypothetical protein UW05_C0005G0022 [Candidatus Giovannonibacteria bacterium GW2011_GWC2_43_8]KKT63407.1 MAG: hypothetical protein UW55_C0004G0040 [Candidatus Giovannonibacteria bacterium GW2011_GWA2_44_26]OGF58936.1 MAG: hypothetical protein A2652_03080 [Candidatus